MTREPEAGAAKPGPGPIKLSLHGDGLKLDVELSADVRRRTGSFLDSMAQAIGPVLATFVASRVNAQEPRASVVDVARASIRAGTLTTEDVVRATEILVAELERRTRAFGQVGQAGEGAGDSGEGGLPTAVQIIEAALSRNQISDHQLSELIDLFQAEGQRRTDHEGGAS